VQLRDAQKHCELSCETTAIDLDDEHGWSTAWREIVDGEYDKVDEELKELNEGHDGEAKPQTQHSAQVRDVHQQLKHTQQYIILDLLFIYTHYFCVYTLQITLLKPGTHYPYIRAIYSYIRVVCTGL